MSTGARSISFGFGFTHALGLMCVHCKLREAQCANKAQCCPSCTHWTAYDHNGDELPEVSTVSTLPTCATEQGYQRHRTRRERACDACRDAHSRHNMERRQRRAS